MRKLDPISVLDDQEIAQRMYEEANEGEWGDGNDIQYRLNLRNGCLERLKNVSCDMLDLPKIFLVRVKQSVIDKWSEAYAIYKDRTFILLGEIAQMPHHVIMMDIETKEIIPAFHSYDLELLRNDEA